MGATIAFDRGSKTLWRGPPRLTSFGVLIGRCLGRQLLVRARDRDDRAFQRVEVPFPIESRAHSKRATPVPGWPLVGEQEAIPAA